jgi:hypothetical protein
MTLNQVVAPPLLERALLCILFGLIAVLGLFTVLISPPLWTLALTMVIPGTYLVVLGARAGVLLKKDSLVVKKDSLVVRGLLKSRTIPRAALLDSNRLPCLSWRDSDGVNR